MNRFAVQHILRTCFKLVSFLACHVAIEPYEREPYNANVSSQKKLNANFF